MWPEAELAPLLVKTLAGSALLKLKLLPVVVAFTVLMPMAVKLVMPPVTVAPVVDRVKVGSIEIAPVTPVLVALLKFKGKLTASPARPPAKPAATADPLLAAATTAAGVGAVPNFAAPVGARPTSATVTCIGVGDTFETQPPLRRHKQLK